MRKILFAGLAVLFLLVTFLPGCVPSKPSEEVEILPAERLVNKLEANRRSIKTFEGSGTLLVKSPQLDNKATFRVVLVKPDSIYLTIMGPFGIELAQALVTKDNFVFYDALRNTAYEGALNDDVLKNIFRINLPFSSIIDAFVGSVNLTKHLYKKPSDYSVDYDKYVMTYTDSLTKVTTQYHVDIRQLGITSYKVTNDQGDVLLDGKYSDFSILENVAVPYTINVQDKKDDQSVLINYKKMEANKKDIYIDFKLPSDANVIQW